MKQEQKKTLILVIVLVVLVIFAGYFLLGRGPDESVLLTETNTGAAVQSSVLGSDVLRLISQVDGLELSTNVFDDKTFLNLKDISVPVQSEGVGKQNPFSGL